MNLLLEKPADVSALSPLTLAFVGDSVFDLLVRSELVCEANRPVDTLHKPRHASSAPPPRRAA